MRADIPDAWASWLKRRLAIVAFVGVSASFSTADAPHQANVQQPTETVQTAPINEPRNAPEKPSGPPAPKGAAAIQQHDAKCSRTLTVSADALFEIDRWTLNPDAGQTLDVLGAMIVQAGKYPIRIESFTDSTTADNYAPMLTEKRALTVRGWLVNHGFAPVGTPIAGLGKQNPVVPSNKPGVGDDPLSRQQNRRIEVVIDICK